MGISTDAQNQEAFPAWADEALSDELSRIIGAGEAQAVEFKSQYPAQASDLGKEIAAFATSNDGRIIVGVGDGGDILGLEECRTQQGRAKIVSRVEGLCANGVRPSVTPDVRFALVEDKPLLVIEVAKGSAPIYYSKSIPYLRQITSARPMTPDEVIDHVLAWKKEDEAAANTPESRYLGQLAGLLASVEITAREWRTRQIKPWLDELRWAANDQASSIRKLAASAPDSHIDTAPVLEEIAAALEVIAHERPTLNTSRAPILQATDDICERVEKIRARWLPPEIFGPQTVAGQQEALQATERQLAGLARRIKADPSAVRIPDILEESAEYGMDLLRLSSIGIGIGDSEQRDLLWQIGERLRELQTRRRYHDGGQSDQRIRDDLIQANDDLQRILATVR